MSKYACGLNVGDNYPKGRRPSKCKCARLSSSNVVLSGCVKTTHVLDERKAIKCTLYTYYLNIENKTGTTLCNVGLYLDVRSLAKSPDGNPWVCPGLCEDLPNECVQVILSSADGACECECNKSVHFRGVGQFLCVPKLKPGKSIVTVILTVCNENGEPCPPDCTIFPALFSLKVKKCCGKNAVFCTSTLVGCQPEVAKCPTHECEGDVCGTCCDGQDDW